MSATDSREFALPGTVQEHLHAGRAPPRPRADREANAEAGTSTLARSAAERTRSSGPPSDEDASKPNEELIGSATMAAVGRQRRDPVGDAAAVPRLWTVFVLGWLLMLTVVSAQLIQDRGSLLRMAASGLAVAVLAALYLRLALRNALTKTDVSRPDGPHAIVLRRRSGMVAGLAVPVGALVLLNPGREMWWLAMYAIIAAGLALPVRLAVPTIAALLGAAIACAWLVTGRFDPVLMIQVAIGASAIAVRQLTISIAQLRVAREDVAGLAVAEERLRFARDVHDLLGHSLSLIVLKSQLTARLLPEAPAQAANELRDLESAARESLRQIRYAMAGHRPTLERELRAAGELLVAAGIEPIIHRAIGPLPAAVDSLLAWSVREGVTNVIRHSRARRCVVYVMNVDGWAQVEVSDNGRGNTDGSTIGGSGLAGLRDRLTPHRGDRKSVV